MKPWERRLLHAAAILLIASGAVYGWMKYLLTSDDPFALVNHPWQNVVLGLHVMVAPLFVLAFGIVLNSHVMKKLRVPQAQNRTTGYLSLATFALMTVSGYLLQVTTSEGWLQALVIAHIGSGLLFTASYAVHLAISWRMSRRSRAARSLASVA